MADAPPVVDPEVEAAFDALQEDVEGLQAENALLRQQLETIEAAHAAEVLGIWAWVHQRINAIRAELEGS